MTEELFNNIQNGRDVRSSLIKLRQLIRKDKKGTAVSEIDPDKTDILVDLLSDEDAKIRKNAALILGELKDDSLLSVLMYAYEHEDKLFIRSDYLTAIGMLDYSPVMSRLKDRLRQTEEIQTSDENRKHLAAEEKQLRNLILKKEPPAKHIFTGWHRESDIILVVSPGFEDITKNDIPEGLCSLIKTGKGALYVRTDDIRKIFSLRTVKNFLFVFRNGQSQHTDPDGLAADITDCGLTEYIRLRHRGEAPYYFRLDMRTSMAPDERSKFISRLSSAIEERSSHHLLNSASDYEFTIRIMEGKTGKYSLYLEMNTIPDTRFSYRKRSFATSMSPVRAAEIAAVLSGYFREDAAVLDPFCGNGTLLIERDRRLRAKYMYGVDIYGEAIRGARENAAAAGRDIFFINRNCLEFTHKYLFDEMITELPAISGKMKREDLEHLYEGFAGRIPTLLREDGLSFICTSEPEIFQKILRRVRNVEIIQVIQMSGKKGDTLFVCKLVK